MRRFTLVGRLSSILVLALLTVWLILVVAAYGGRDWQEQNFWPSPSRIASMANAVDAAGPAGRPALLDALNSPILAARVDTPAEVAGEPANPADEAVIRRYSEALGDRAFTISRFAGSRPSVAFLSLDTSARRLLEFRIGLKDGETLIVICAAPFIVTPFGLPVGVGGGLVAAIAALAALIAMYRELRPLRRLATTLDKLDLDGAPLALPDVSRRSEELRAVVAAIERLQTRLAQLLRARMVMLGGISHDVRTFATRLRLRADYIADPEQHVRAVQDIDDMIHLLDDAILAARAGEKELGEELIDFAELLRAEVGGFASAGMAVELAIEPSAVDALVLGDRVALRRIVANLVGNAIQYGDIARLALVASAGEVVLRVSDDGPGVPPAMAADLTEPFVRGEASRNRETGGAGLGLAIARALVEAQGGTLSIVNAPVGGLLATVRLPQFFP